MSKQIIIDPVTRIEGHSKVTIQLDDQGKVNDARFHITQFRGFEKFVIGRPFYEMPSLMPRICGICTISHAVAAAKTCDAIMGVTPPEAGYKLRELINYASTLQSHALSFYHLSSPDLLLGMDSDPVSRSIFGVIEKYPELARDGIFLRRYGQQIIESLAGKRIHTTWVVAGGVASPISDEIREAIVTDLDKACGALRRGLEAFRGLLQQYESEIENFGNYPSHYMGLVNGAGGADLYHGQVRVKDHTLHTLAQFNASDYRKYISEAVEPWSYLKFPFYKPLGFEDGLYRVGPLARLNVVDKMGTIGADAELVNFRKLNPSSSFNYHYARLIEMLFCLEKIDDLIHDPAILGKRVRAEAGVNANAGVGIIEAPRGVLIHHYEVDDDGRMTWANLVVSTTHNNLAMNKSVRQVAETYIDGNNLTEGMLNRVEAVIRTYDPCLSCSTHATGQLPLLVQLLGPGGELLDEASRS